MRWKKIVALITLLAAVSAALGFSLRGQSKALKLSGIVETQPVRLGSKVGGRVAAIAVREGEVVEAGTALVFFELPELQTQKDQLEAKIRGAYAELERVRNGPRAEEKAAAKAAYESALALHQRVKAGFRAEEVDQARAELAAARVDLKRSVQELERSAYLYHHKAESAAAYEAALALRDRLEAEVKRVEARLNLLVAGSRPEDLDDAAAKLAQAKSNYDLLLAGSRPEEIAAAEARLAELQGRLAEINVSLAEGVIKAPEKALVEVLPVRKGDIAGPNQPVVRLLRPDDLWVKVFVPETDLGKVRLNETVTVSVDAYPGKRFTGTVIQVASISEFTPRNVQSSSERRFQMFAVKVHIADPEGVFKSGMAAEVMLPLHD